MDADEEIAKLTANGFPDKHKKSKSNEQSKEHREHKSHKKHRSEHKHKKKHKSKSGTRQHADRERPESPHASKYGSQATALAGGSAPTGFDLLYQAATLHSDAFSPSKSPPPGDKAQQQAELHTQVPQPQLPSNSPPQPIPQQIPQQLQQQQHQSTLDYIESQSLLPPPHYQSQFLPAAGMTNVASYPYANARFGYPSLPSQQPVLHVLQPSHVPHALTSASTPPAERIVVTLTEAEEKQLLELHSIWHTTADTNKKLRERGIPFASGSWSTREAQLLSQNVNDFLLLHKVNVADDILKGKDKALTKAFYIKAAHGIWRPMFHIYRRVLRSYGSAQDTKFKPFTSEESKTIVELHNKYGNDWNRIGEVLGRSGPSVGDHYRHALRFTHKREGAWTDQETHDLVQIMLTDEVQKAARLPWMAIAAKLKTRSAAQCRQKWRYSSVLQHQVKKMLTAKASKSGDGEASADGHDTFEDNVVTPLRKWSQRFDWQLVQRLIDLNVPTLADVNWRDIAKMFDNHFTAPRIMRRMKLLLRLLPPQVREQDFQSCLRKLIEDKPKITVRDKAASQAFLTSRDLATARSGPHSGVGPSMVLPDMPQVQPSSHTDDQEPAAKRHKKSKKHKKDRRESESRDKHHSHGSKQAGEGKKKSKKDKKKKRKKSRSKEKERPTGTDAAGKEAPPAL